MSHEDISKALAVIHDEAVALLAKNLRADVRAGVESILANARYNFDVSPRASIRKRGTAKPKRKTR